MNTGLYRSINSWWRERYGERVHKVSLDAGFTCPNRDGTKAVGGCIYCNNDSFNFSPQSSLHDQLAKGIRHVRGRFHAKKVIAYFQTYSNTYDSPDHLEKIYSVVHDFPEVVGLSIGTRPDCVPEEALRVIEKFAATHEVWLEFGLESSNDDSLRRINRAHTFADFTDAVRRTAGRGIRIGAHVIAGFPWESREMMLQTASDVAALPLDAIKIHNLHVVRGTALETMYQRSQFPLLSLEDYAAIAAEMLEILPPEILILRLNAECPANLLVAPDWCNQKQEIVAAIERQLLARNSRQGAKFAPVTV